MNIEEIKTLQILIDARDLLRDPARWTKELYARNAHGQTVGVGEPDAVCWCAVGAIRKVAAGISYAGGRARHEVESRVVGTNLPTFNDAPTTTHSDILALFDTTIKQLKEKHNEQPAE